MNRNIMVIMNPFAGKRNHVKTNLYTICERFNQWQDHISIYMTQYAKHAKELAVSQGETYDILVCIGGDGTWNEVVSGIMGLDRKPILCYLPSGTVNDFANTLQLPMDASKMMNIVEQNHLFQCDIGRFNRRYFTYVAAFGIFTDISYQTPQSSKNVFGRMAYFLEGVKQLTKIPHYRVHMTCDDDTEYEDDIMFGCISNSKYVAGFTSVSSQHAELDDGLFEVLLIRKPNNPLDIQNIVAALLKREINERWMYFCKASSLIIQSDEKIAWTLDGEDGGKTSTARILNKHKAITLLTQDA